MLVLVVLVALKADTRGRFSQEITPTDFLFLHPKPLLASMIPIVKAESFKDVALRKLDSAPSSDTAWLCDIK